MTQKRLEPLPLYPLDVLIEVGVGCAGLIAALLAGCAAEQAGRGEQELDQ